MKKNNFSKNMIFLKQNQRVLNINNLNYNNKLKIYNKLIQILADFL